MSPIQTRQRNERALAISRFHTSLKKCGLELPPGATVIVGNGGIHVEEKRNWRATGVLVSRLRNTMQIFDAPEVDQFIDCPNGADGRMLSVSFSQPESGCADYILRTYSLIAEEETTPASPGEQIRALPRRPGAPSTARRLAGR